MIFVSKQLLSFYMYLPYSFDDAENIELCKVIKAIIQNMICMPN